MPILVPILQPLPFQSTENSEHKHPVQHTDWHVRTYVYRQILYESRRNCIIEHLENRDDRETIPR